MKKLLVSVLLSTALVSSPSLACGNADYIELINYHYIELNLSDGFASARITEDKVAYGVAIADEDRKKFVELVKKLDNLYQKSKNVDYLSDKGLVLMYLGDYQQAKDIFLNIEKIKPNRYSTASNLGTTYELLGDNKNALKWIKKAVKINPQSHNYSEWIHINILDAKVKREQFYTAKYILKTDFGNKKLPTSQLSESELQNLNRQLLYQINERVHFIKPKNKILAELIYALANTNFLLGDYIQASYYYQEAEKYGYQSEQLQQRMQIAEEKHENKEKRDEYLLYAFIAFVGLLFLASIGLFFWFVWYVIKYVMRK